MNKAKELSDEIAHWMQKLAPKFPDISAHDLHLILWSLLRSKYGGKPHFLLRRRSEGGYVR